MEQLNGNTDSTPISHEMESPCFGGAGLKNDILNRVDPVQYFGNSNIATIPEPLFPPVLSSSVATASEPLFQSARPTKRKNDVTNSLQSAQPTKRINDAKPREPLFQSARPTRGRKKTTLARPLSKPPDAPARGIHWHLLKPPPTKTQATTMLTVADRSGEALNYYSRPRIWAHTLSELVEIFPALSKAVGGISFNVAEFSSIILDGPTWPHDRWLNNETLELHMMRNFSCTELDLQSHVVDVAMFDEFTGDGDYSASAPKYVCYSHEGFTTTAIERRMNPFISSECFHHHVAFMGIPTNSRDSDIGKPNDSGLQSDTIYNSPKIHSQTLPLACTIFHPGKRQIPKEIPPEIEALVDAHRCGMPVSVIVSQNSALFPMQVPQEYGCCFLGFFFVTDIKISFSSVEGLFLEEESNDIRVEGRVEWTVSLQWTSGGEDFFPDSCKANFTRPWWSNNNANVEIPPYMLRQDLLRDCHSLLPKQLLVEPTPYLCTDVIPKGWLCLTCGKLNHQTLFRHRKCFSSVCQIHSYAEIPTVGYAISLDYARDRYQHAPLVGPINTLPTNVLEASSRTPLVDGMTIHRYPVRPFCQVKHIFTSNRESLQTEASRLFHDIQVNVQLRRQPKGPGYFVHSVTSSPPTWTDAPKCLRDAQDLMVHRGRTHGETPTCSIDELTLLAWVTPGNGKGPVLRAKLVPATLLCLGANAVLTLRPHSGFGIGDHQCTSVIQHGIIPDRVGDVDGIKPASTEVANPSAVPKPSKDAIVITLVHGDALVITGDDFECHIKRTGTTILLIGESSTLR